MERSYIETMILNKLSSHSVIADGKIVDKLLSKLMNVNEVLFPNIIEWVTYGQFSDIWIRDKYCLNAVLKIRGNPTSPLAIADAILALNAYAENDTNEHLIWQQKRM